MLSVRTQSDRPFDPQRSAAGRCCVFVSSSDRGRDIFQIVFQNAERMWRDCNWPRYVGFTSKHPDQHGFTTIVAKAPSNWQGELGDQLDALPPHIDYVLRMDEDALFLSPVDGAKLDAIADLMAQQDLSYVSLIPLSRNIPGQAIEYFRRRLSKRPLRRLSFSEPYYSSVALAIWKRNYLRDLLRRPGTIWEFEHIVTEERHYATWKPVLDQFQIVTKGKWNRMARPLLARVGIALEGTNREFQTSKSVFRAVREKISFQLFGFLSLRLRKRFNRLPTRPVY